MALAPSAFAGTSARRCSAALIGRPVMDSAAWTNRVALLATARVAPQPPPAPHRAPLVPFWHEPVCGSACQACAFFSLLVTTTFSSLSAPHRVRRSASEAVSRGVALIEVRWPSPIFYELWGHSRPPLVVRAPHMAPSAPAATALSICTRIARKAQNVPCCSLSPWQVEKRTTLTG